MQGIDKPNGSGVEYGYDLLARTKTLTEWAGVGKPEYMTTYSYDTFDNLKSVLDPVGGLTTMKYDVVNRLTKRALPNSVKTTYEYDDLDRVTKITHINTITNQILSSVTYDREGIGEPTKITREDGTYVKLKYDASLRVEKESYYAADNTLLEETTYTYDATGKRTAKIDRTGSATYNYRAGFQLDKISGASNENYDYDANGRLTLIERDGKTIDLEHDAGDRLTTVENETTGKTTQYIYDGAGNRVKAIEGGNVRQFLVAPAMGSGLESNEAISDGNGNLISNYIYAGGHTPFMMLDASGNPVYYLTDAMGTVIGLADGTGQEVADFRYDAFGNSRGATDSAANMNTAGGDFRFQGQWLESETGIYYFRARDYDVQTGRFLSRDPVDIIETEPESMNPYQFVYNNPYVYSDPTGMFSIVELNSALTVQDILDNIQTYAANQVKEYLKDKVSEFLADAFTGIVKRLLPFNAFESMKPFSRGYEFEDFLKGQICGIFNSVGGPFTDRLWIEPYVKTDGEPTAPGLNCQEVFIKAKAIKGKGSRPDFIFKQGSPTDYKAANPDAYLIGDIKIAMSKALEEITSGDNQWIAMRSHAEKYQITRSVLYITFKRGKGLSDSELARLLPKAQKGAFKKQVILYIANLVD